MLTHLGGCEIREQLHQRSGTTVYRGRRIEDDRPVVLKVVSGEAPPGALLALRHEHAILGELDGIEGVPRTFGLVHDGGHWALLLEELGGTSLAALGVAGTLSVVEVLELGLAVTAILERIHRRRVMHKDLNPANLVWDRAAGRLALIDFGIATVLPRETTAFVSARGLEGTLAYVSPEQTGRMNRALDYRTDYYSLGVTLYEIASGRLPFTAADPLEFVHYHIARQPPPLAEISPGVPPPLAAIIHKLMAKSADDRYQSAQGIRADLARCLTELGQRGEIAPFAVGQLDRSERFHL
ncbi:MAG TPA: serine/threonine-protein kinase, partial [Haliangium sp.]|nr:serine/threonine-protein kinase [Haliangium sp.]